MERYRISSGALYPALIRLEGKGLVSSRWAEGTSPRRRVYALTTQGRCHMLAPATHPLADVLATLEGRR